MSRLGVHLAGFLIATALVAPIARAQQAPPSDAKGATIVPEWAKIGARQKQGDDGECIDAEDDPGIDGDFPEAAAAGLASQVNRRVRDRRPMPV